MSECRNVALQEQLPEYLHGGLSQLERAAVSAHLEVCPECSEERDLLQAARAVMQINVSPVNVDAIVAALPRPRVVRGDLRRRSSGQSWRMAAAMTVIVLGGLSLATLRTFVAGGPITADSLRRDTAVQITAMVDSPRSDNVRSDAVAASLSDLADEDLEMLIGSMESLEAVPLAEPDVSSRRFGVTEGGN